MRSAAVKTLSRRKPAFAALLVVLAFSAIASEASALPGIDRTPAAQLGRSVEKARWVCGPYQCWWQPGYGWGGGYGYGWGGGGPGWRRQSWGGPGWGGRGGGWGGGGWSGGGWGGGGWGGGGWGGGGWGHRHW
ncbi:MAG TPA: hypothetical protein VIF88_11460 [Methylocystis sp.]|jgi:hypothetical protein